MEFSLETAKQDYAARYEKKLSKFKGAVLRKIQSNIEEGSPILQGNLADVYIQDAKAFIESIGLTFSFEDAEEGDDTSNFKISGWAN